MFLLARFLPILLIFITYLPETVFAADTGGIAQTPGEVCPSLPGTDFPVQTVTTAKGESFSITESLTAKPAVIIFYRGGWCPYCNLHLQGLRVIEDELIELGYSIFAISPDKPDKLSESMATHGMQYTLLSDSDLSLGRALGIVFQEKEEHVAFLRDRGMDIEENSGRDHHLLPVPAVFIVDTEATIRFTYVHPDYRIRLDSDVILTVSKSLLKSNWRVR
jgi:peroxiredoxin